MVVPTLQRNGIMEESLRWSAAGQAETSIAFPYYRGDRLLNVKYRSLGKKFRQVPILRYRSKAAANSPIWGCRHYDILATSVQMHS